MNQFHKLFRWAWSVIVVCTLAFAMGGCDGKDGAQGPAGPTGATGPEGPPGPGAAIVPLESCAVCHDDGSVVDAAVAHALPPIAFGQNVSFAIAGADLAVSFSLVVDGAPGLGYDTVERGYQTDGATRTDICNAPSRSDPCDPGSLTVAPGAAPGDYTVTVIGGAVAANDNRYLFRVSDGGVRETRVYFYGDYGVAPVGPPAVSAAACTNCHGPEGIGVHGGYYAAEDGAEPCLVCHGVDTVPSLGEVAHGFHSSIWVEDPAEGPIHITYPTYMNNCSVCHDSPATLAAANAMPVVADACFSCHGDASGIPFGPTAAIVHANIVDGCETCHAGQIGGIPQNVAQSHNGATTERGGIIWDGVDTSVTEGALFDWQITGVTDDGTDLSITWQVTYNGVGVNPCNATAAAGAPVFFADVDADGDSLGNLSILRNYAQGQDFILGTNANAAGQPGSSPGVNNANTTCVGNVATTVVPVEATTATVGRVAIQGKPRVVSIDPDDADGLMAVRAKTPTYDWIIGSSNAADPRRAVADTALCLKCHVGSLYQHGGNRVDNIDMCYLCHNPAANDQYVRASFGGVDASESYDGRSGQSFGIKEMVHAVHPAGATGNRVVIYRGRGIYGWADDVSTLSNWPSGANCTQADGDTGSNYYTVFGSDAATATAEPCQPHNFHVPTYPRGLYDCAACHVATVDILPGARVAMATTVETGAAPFGDQLNDVLEGVQTSSCVTCHGDSAAKGHAYQNGWVPQDFEEGRQTIIDAN